MKFRYLLAFLAVFIPGVVFAQADLGINAAGVWLSVPYTSIEVSKTVRIYARVENASAEDSVAEVQFYINDAVLGTRSISVLANSNGVAFWDWSTPTQETTATITVRVHDQMDGDTNPANDTVTIYDLRVNADADGDGVYNAVDNCRDVANANQADADKDGQGDACEPPPPAPAPTPTPKPAQTPPTTTTPAPVAEPEVQETSVSETSTAQPVPTSVSTSTNSAETTDIVEMNGERTVVDSTVVPGEASSALVQELVIQAEQIGWNQFRFRPSSRLGSGSFEYEWSFGDGQNSSDRVVEHTFSKPGRFTVNLRVLEPNGSQQVSSMVVRVGFFNLANWRLWVIIGLLALIIILSAVTAGASDALVGEQKPKEADDKRESMPSDTEEIDLEPLTDETGEMDSLAATGETRKDLADDLALLESLGSAKTEAEPKESVSLASQLDTSTKEDLVESVDEEEPAKPKAKKKTTKKRPGKKRSIKVKNVS